MAGPMLGVQVRVVALLSAPAPIRRRSARMRNRPFRVRKGRLQRHDDWVVLLDGRGPRQASTTIEAGTRRPGRESLQNRGLFAQASAVPLESVEVTVRWLAENST